MQFTFVLLSCLLGSVIALPATELNTPAIEREQDPTPVVEKAMGDVGRSLERLESIFDNQVSWKTDANRATNDAQLAIDTVIKALRSGAKEVRKGSAIKIDESTKLLDWVNALTKLYKSTMDGLVKQKQVVSAAGTRSCGTNVVDSLVSLSHWTADFNDAVNGKMSVLSAGVGLTVKTEQLREIKKAIAAYDA